MQTELLQQQLDPYKLCAGEQQLSLELDLTSFARAQEALASSVGKINFTLSFSKNHQQVLEVAGNLQGEVYLECQRCLKPLLVELDNDFLWGLATDEDAARNLPRTHEPVFLTSGKLQLLDALEDELILSLPVVPLHAENACQLSSEFTQIPAEFGMPKQQTNPFNALVELQQALKNK